MEKAASTPIIHVLRLSPGQDLKVALETANSTLKLQGIQAACVISAVGSFSKATIRFAAEAGATALDEPLELITLSGTMGTGGLHLHLSVADSRGRMFGGHVMPGCIVRTTAEIVLALLPGWVFDRELDTATGFRELAPRQL